MTNRGQVISGQRTAAITTAALSVMAIASATARAQVGEWMLVSETGPSPRAAAALAFDAARGVTVLYGGTSGYVNSETWEYDGVAWREVQPVLRPPGRLFTPMVFDSRRGVCVLFGGYDSPNHAYLDDTWEYDGSSWTQRNLTGPDARQNHVMVYDSNRGVTVLHGGLGIGGLRRDTWEYDGVQWRQVSLDGPGDRYGHAMAYDSERGVSVMFGGLAVPGGFDWLGDTWEWDGAQWRLASTTGPSGRGTDMAYDAARRLTVMYGGFNGSRLGDMWEWDGARWLINRATGPDRRSTSLAYDSARRVLMLFGGAGDYGQGTFGDTWEYRDGIRVALTTSCPQSGPATGSWKDATPDGLVSLIYAGNAEPFRIPGQYPCAGTLLLLGDLNRHVVVTGRANSRGRGTVYGYLSAFVCGGYLQALDHTTCQTSNLVRIE